MVHNNRAGIICIAIGVVLILSALLLFLVHEISNIIAEQDTDAILERIKNDIAAQTSQACETQIAEEEQAPIPETSVTEPESEIVTENTTGIETEQPVPVISEMTVLTIDGYDYIGYIEIPALELALPVMADWNEEKLKLAPCRHFGSTKTDDLVIAGHNYRRHFANFTDLDIGDSIRFTDMDGQTIEYTIGKIDLLEPDAVWRVLDSNYDLILYTCDYSGGKRIAVFCERNVINSR